jgi:glycosyltransferase involved in cell wall biosynthesis
VRHARIAGWNQRVVVGVPADQPYPEVAELEQTLIHPLRFGDRLLDFAVPGMSDVMPYRSTRFSSMSASQLRRYKDVWHAHLERVVRQCRPDLIHSHHVWLVSAMIKDVSPGTPVVTQCHGTGFRQMELCPHLAEDVCAGCRRNDRFVVLHRDHADRLGRALGVAPDRIHVVGAGYREDLFHATGRRSDTTGRLLYIGKYSAAKGLPWLLDAFERLQAQQPSLELHVAGAGAGDEAEVLKTRMQRMAPSVVLHGQLPQADLADLMRTAAVCVLPSLYEGLPLVLVEAMACGCRLVATALPGVVEELEPHLGSALELVPLPRLVAVDRPDPADLDTFVDHLEAALARSLASPPLGDPAQTMPNAVSPMTWRSVFERVEAVWLELLGPGQRGASRAR